LQSHALLEIALLDGAHRMIDDNETRLALGDERGDLLNLARTQQC
jgi:hypothetical protein